MLEFSKQALWTGLAALILALGLWIAAFAVFPIGGGEYHAIFAYTDEGRLRPALVAYATYLTSLAFVSGVLVWRRYPARWWLVATAGTLVGMGAWWGICAWKPQAASFHAIVMGLLPGFPIVLTSLTWAVARRSHGGRPVSTHSAA